MVWDNIPRTHSFSLGDFHDFDRCVFKFLVNHHLQKKYELSEGSSTQAIGSLLDLSIKKFHAAKAYGQPADYLINLVKAAENDIKEQAEREGPRSFYGGTLKFLTPEVLEAAGQVLKSYYEKRQGKINRALLNKRFWECLLEGDQLLRLWGGPDTLELGDDGIAEIVDYKYFTDEEKGQENLDMDLMPKLYTLLCASELLKAGHKEARFKVRSWKDPLNESLYEEFDLMVAANLKDFFRHKIEKILSISEVTFCGKPYCRACNSDQKESWLKELSTKGFI